MNRINSLISKKVIAELPYPHLFINNFLTDSDRLSIRASFVNAEFFTMEGGSPSSYINFNSPPPLFSWSNDFLKKILIPQLDAVFEISIREKEHELLKNYRKVKKLIEPKFGYLHLSKQNVGSIIPSHRDDDRSTYQFVIYLGGFNGEEAETTQLIYVDDIELLERTKNCYDLKLVDYGNSANGFLCFVNQMNSYHCLTGPTKNSRMMVLGSVVHYESQ